VALSAVMMGDVTSDPTRGTRMEDKPILNVAVLRTDEVQAIVCPTCSADVGESCRTRDTRKVTKTHAKRLRMAGQRLSERMDGGRI